MDDVSQRCSSLAQARQDPLVGTAYSQAITALVEVRGPWGRDVWQDADDSTSALFLADRQELVRWAAERGVKLLAIRQPHRTGADRRWFVAHHQQAESERPAWISGQWQDSSTLMAGLAEALGTPQSIPPSGEAVAPTPPVLAVCTQGKRDVCCAVQGRPVLDALSGLVVAAGGESHRVQVWECSHVGGHRFAANVVTFPSGDQFGAVTPENCAQLLEGVFASPAPGEGSAESSSAADGLAHDWPWEIWRGRAGLEPIQQVVVQSAARQGLAPAIPAIARREHDEPTRSLQSSGRYGALEWTLSGEAQEVPGVSCGSSKTELSWSYRVTWAEDN